MPLDVDRPSRYRPAINLYVEDGATGAYLSALWRDSSVTLFVGGGNDGVDAIARVEQLAGHRNVFGLIDRDYRQSNRDRWLDPQKTFAVFILPVHEIENYMLDAGGLRASRYHNQDLTLDEIDAHLKVAASRLCWWSACRDALAELKRRFRDEFINDPPRSIDGEEAVVRHICGSPWFAKLAGEASRSTEAEVRHLLTQAYNRATASLSDDTWRIEFAGKEIVKDISSRICNRPGITNFPLNDSEFYEDLAKDVAAWQVENNSVPPDLTVLLDALKARIAKRPPGR